MGRRTRTDWTRQVLRSKRITDSTRVLLLYLAEHLNPDLTVSVPRESIVEDLGRSQRRLAERFKAAKDAGFLDSVARGYPGRTAVYQATFPDMQWVTEASTHSEAKTVTHSSGERATPGGPATSRNHVLKATTEASHQIAGSTESEKAQATKDLVQVGDLTQDRVREGSEPDLSLLAELPGRCQECLFHVETQGHGPECSKR